MALSRDSILKANDRKYGEIDVPEWGGALSIRSLSGADRDKLGKHLKQHGSIGFSTLVVLLGAATEDGKRLFKDDDYEGLNARCPKVMDRVAETILKLNGLDEDAAEEMEKN